MTPFDQHNDRPDEFGDVEKRLRDAVPPASPTELDQIKLRAMSQARAPRSGGRQGSPRVAWLRARWLSLGLAAAILGGTAATGVASDGFHNWGGNSGKSQYQPGHCYGHHSSWSHSFGHDGWCKPHWWWWDHKWHHQPPPVGTGTTTTGTTTTTTGTGTTTTGTTTTTTGTTTTTTGTTTTTTGTTTTGTVTSATPPPVHHHHHKKPPPPKHHKHKKHHHKPLKKHKKVKKTKKTKK